MSRWHDLAKDLLRNMFQPRPGLREFGLKELLPSFADLSARDALWDINDPMPAVGELWRTAKDLAVSDVKGIMRTLSPATTRIK